MLRISCIPDLPLFTITERIQRGNDKPHKTKENKQPKSRQQVTTLPSMPSLEAGKSLAENATETPKDNNNNVKNNNNGEVSKASSSSKGTKEKPSLASVSDVFSFSRTRQTKLQMIGAFAFAILSGATFPSKQFFVESHAKNELTKDLLTSDCESVAMVFYFAKAFEDLSRSTDDDEFMDTVRSMVYAFLVLGVIILCSMTTQNFLAESAAETMTHNLKTDWFRALLRQDAAYFDIRDVSGEATIISSNGNRYHRKFGTTRWNEVSDATLLI